MTPGTTRPDPLEIALLALLLSRHPAPVHADDLARAFAGDDWQAAASALDADGVIHREGRVHLLSRPALRVTQLLQ